MSHPEELKRLNAEIASHLTHLSKTMIYVLALYVLGMVILRHCGQVQIATFLGELLHRKPETMKGRLRELTYEAPKKRGEKRHELTVSTCFSPLLSWVLAKFDSENRQLVLALDATYLGDRFVILVVSVVVAGTAIPVAWHIQHGDQKGEWNRIWKTLLTHLQPAIPSHYTVYVLSDSGLYSKTLFQQITKTFHWHALMRIEGQQGTFKATDAQRWRPLRDRVVRGMSPVSLEGTCFKTNPLTCTLVLQWGADYDHPCLIVTDLKPAVVQHQVYAIRYWIECGFKDFKRGLFHWEQTKMTDPKRAERLWLVMSIALLWLTAVGDAHMPPISFDPANPSPKRKLSAPLQGWIEVIVALLSGKQLPYGSLHSYSWPPLPDH